MKKCFFLCTVFLVVFGFSLNAGAVSFDLGSGSFWSLGTGWAGQGDNETLNVRFWIDPNLDTIAFNLEAGQVTPWIRFGKIIFDEEGWINKNEMDNLGVAGNLDFDAPEDHFVNLPGNTVAIEGRTNDRGADLRISFDPVTVLFGSGGSFTVDLTDVTFTDDHQYRTVFAWVQLNDAPTLTDELRDNEPEPESHSLPEPGTLVLFGAGLVSLSAFSRNKFKAR